MDTKKAWRVRAEARETQVNALTKDLDKVKEELRKLKAAPTALSDVELAALSATVAAHTVVARVNLRFTYDGQAARDRLHAELVRRGVITGER